MDTISKFCSRKCYFSYRKGMVTNPSGTNQWSKQ